MALRTNSKAAKQNIMEYIMQDLDYLEERQAYDAENGEPVYNLAKPENVAAYIWQIFQDEKRHEIRRHGAPVAFEDWARGLALGGLFCYYYNRSAVDDLGGILEETEAEKARFTEEQAEELLTKLIYREVQAMRQKAEAPEAVKATETASMNREKEYAVKNYLELVHRSWTWARLTEKERETFHNTVLESYDRITGTYDHRWQILQIMYQSFLNALGYSPINWRGESAG